MHSPEVRWPAFSTPQDSAKQAAQSSEGPQHSKFSGVQTHQSALYRSHFTGMQSCTFCCSSCMRPKHKSHWQLVCLRWKPAKSPEQGHRQSICWNEKENSESVTVVRLGAWRCTTPLLPMLGSPAVGVKVNCKLSQRNAFWSGSA